MIEKLCFYPADAESGPPAIPLFHRSTDSYFEKTAAPQLLPEVVRYIEQLTPVSGSQYVLLNAMGAGEFWGSNVNGDYFTETSLIHKPEVWTGNPLVDKIRSKDWAYGFPTFYYAHPYAHHRNKDSTKAFGEVELAAWNPRMKRVELVARVDHDKCQKFGGTGVWDKISIGGFPDVSMGCRVPFDTCSICLDWDRYKKAWATFDPKKHKSPGEAILAAHKKSPIRGVSITRKDYCEHARDKMNKILPDGRKVFVYNDFPKFFDISFVFIGADKTAKVMMKIAGEGKVKAAHSFLPAGYASGEEEKTAASPEDAFAYALAKAAKQKKGEIVKDVFPSQFAGKAIPALTAGEEDIPKRTLDLLGSRPLGESLSTLSGLGMVLRPREFQRIILTSSGGGRLADDLDRRGEIFPRVEESLPVPFGGFSSALASLLLPLLLGRSGFGPAIEKRVIVLVGRGEEKKEKKAAWTPSSLSSDVLRKIGAAYNGYRQGVMNLVVEAQDMIGSSALQSADLDKIASASAESFLTPLSAAYFKLAFWDEVAPDVERGSPSKTR